LAVEEHDTVPRLHRASLGRFVAFLIMLETPAEALGRQYALQKCQIAFAVLGPDRPDGQDLRHIERMAHLRIVGQQFADQVACILVLEDIAVAPQSEQGQRRLQMQPIARQAAIGAEPGGVGAQAVPRAAAAIRLQQGDRQLFTDEAR
jgi:hypothetical protein